MTSFTEHDGFSIGSAVAVAAVAVVAVVASAAFSVAFFWFAYQVDAIIRQDRHNRFLRKMYSLPAPAPPAPEPPASQGGGCEETMKGSEEL